MRGILRLSGIMPKVAFENSYTSIWRGVDCLKLIDGLSCNKVIGLEKGHAIQTAIINNHAKIIDFITVINFGDFLAIIGFLPNYDALIDYVTPKILQSDVSISNVSHLNDVIVIFDENSEIEKGKFISENGVTEIKIYERMTLCISSKGGSLEIDSSEIDFNKWRIDNTIPWYDYEIRNNLTPYSSGLNNFVHESKGCFAGQEILTRMRTRERGIKKLMKVDNTSIDAKKITTKGEKFSLAIF